MLAHLLEREPARLAWLSDWLSPLQEILLRRGYQTLYIGGSSAREILDAIFFGAPLSLRDLDVYLLKYGAVQASDVEALCRDITAAKLAEVGPLREKRRANPRLSKEACYQYLAGFGAHLYAKNKPILSLGVLHYPSDLLLNGLFDIDTTFLVVDASKRFSLYQEQVSLYQNSDEPLCHSGLFLDPHQGYLAWRKRSPKIVHWEEVERSYARSALRMVRSLAKASVLTLPPALQKEYQRRSPKEILLDDRVELHRDFLKILGDLYWAEELCMLANLSALTPLSASLQRKIALTTSNQLRQSVPSPLGIDALTRSCLRVRSLGLTPSLEEALLSVAPLVFGAETT